ncbi:helix-turn-helix domain-containing protein [Brevibacillus dissolubilis]|uniref:helix-turn-helix domain-containing protein n=1 Tax=Brevibacillus dissolubilis TaxID=1844116 RepID=UPI001116824E|nr:helix-turn-helix transcriptional regulator [Brevibacillus dissolubilis]
MPVHVRLKEILAERGMSQRELARLTGLRASTINHLCSDKVDRVYLETLDVICKRLDIRIEQLLEVE